MNSSLVAQMAWVHLALIAVPLLIAILDLEWKDWRNAHPRAPAKKSRMPEAFYQRTDSVFGS